MNRNLPPDACFLAIDQGGHGSRAIIYDRHGRAMARGDAPVETLHPQKDQVEHDPAQMLQSLRDAMASAVREFGAPQRIVAAGLATQRSNLLCWDRESGDALTPIISWQDRRAAGLLRDMALDTEAVHRATGLFVTAHYGASKFRWCLDHVPAVAEARDRGTLVMGPMASYLAWHLSGRGALAADPANASRTLLWNLRARDWDEELLRAFGLERAWFPRCVDTRYAYGSLDAGGHDIPLGIVTGDQSAAMFAFGPMQPDTAYINIGTGAFVSRPAGHYPKFARRLLTGIIHVEAGEPRYVLEGTVNGAGSALEWAEQEYGVDDLYGRLPEWLDSIPEPPLFLNGISGLGAPFWIADFPSRFVGEGDTAARMVAVVESIAFLLHNNMSEMGKFASPPEQVQVTGGLALLDGLCQRIADLSGLPVYRPAESEATARGTAWLVAGGPEDWPENELGRSFRPRPNEELRRRYHRWLDALLQAARGATAS